MANGQRVIELFESFAPKRLALEGDPVGLQIGSLNKEVKRIMITLDVLETVVDEAIEKEIDLIIAHHPPIFSRLGHVTDTTASGRIVMKCIKHDIAVYAAHTNLDVCEGGVNDLMAEALGLHEVKVLTPTFKNTLYKLIVFVPATHAEQVAEALGRAGAGSIGDYSECQFHTSGIGQFRPGTGTSPAIGTIGELERVDEVRIETIVTELEKASVIRAMKKAHPYEEVAYDLFEEKLQAPALGLGRVGKLREPMQMRAFADYVKTTFGVEGVRFVGNPDELVEKVAVLGGDGNKYINAAKFAGADVLVTGDLYFHVAHDAMALALNVVDPGHHVESIMKDGVKREMERRLSEARIKDVELLTSSANTNPFRFA
ncbi:Nif3-like dinuclear metal center hexameric protein [Exiguobacterium flavidum]|uniref:Nif3-like dinuclear metal center hexameric protein n=1 Tax=Exiguobacterium flavidum TaxID=2184695 RepID=UPI000DF82195|nr:Nif3-like dinuclear metal center hexameric protein [Exiguobacterium flavidum]